MTKEQQARKIMEEALKKVEDLGFEVLHPAGGTLFEVDLPIYAECMVFEPFAQKQTE